MRDTLRRFAALLLTVALMMAALACPAGAVSQDEWDAAVANDEQSAADASDECR